jgi:hypothetical protein
MFGNGFCATLLSVIVIIPSLLMLGSKQTLVVVCLVSISVVLPSVDKQGNAYISTLLPSTWFRLINRCFNFLDLELEAITNETAKKHWIPGYILCADENNVYFLVLTFFLAFFPTVIQV